MFSFSFLLSRFCRLFASPFLGDLAKEDAADRLAACERLLASLQTEQATFSSGAKKTVVKSEDAMDESDDEEGVTGSKLAPTVLSANLCPSLSYALKRLTRGLASSRAGARQGFALALTEILAHMPVVQTEDVLAIVADQVKLSAKANKQVGTRHNTHTPAILFLLRFFLFIPSPELSLLMTVSW